MMTIKIMTAGIHSIPDVGHEWSTDHAGSYGSDVWSIDDVIDAAECIEQSLVQVAVVEVKGDTSDCVVRAVDWYDASNGDRPRDWLDALIQRASD